MDRRAIILKGLNLAGEGLEIGAGYNPLVADDPDLDVRVLDHLDQAGLINKYTIEGVDVSRVPFVDFVWHGESYPELMGTGRFDYVVASHVIEHVPDIVEFINQCADVMKDGGTLTLAVPDKRQTFDSLRPNSALSAVIDAHCQKQTLSSPGAVAEHLLYCAHSEGRIVWSERRPLSLDFRYDLAFARFRMDEAIAKQYVDVHAWVFTPVSFRLLIEDLHELGLIRLRERAFFPTVGFEFFIQLSADGQGPDASRIELARMGQEAHRVRRRDFWRRWRRKLAHFQTMLDRRRTG
jgi:SAM-dependent methyltransferase